MKSKLLATVLVVVAGCLAPAFCQEAPETPAGEVLVVRAIWPDQDLSRTRFYVFTDAKMKDLVDVFPVGGASGAGIVGLKRGEYYLMAVVDVNANDKPDAGDGFGFYGVEDCSVGTRPQPFKVGPSDPHTLVVHILMTMDEQGALKPVPAAPDELGTVVGTVTGAAGEQAVVLLLPADEGLQPLACLVREDGAFQLQAVPGTYGLLVVADADDSGSVSEQDLVGWKGQENPEGPDELTVRPGETVDAGGIALSTRELLIEAQDLPAVLAGRVPGAGLAVGAETRLRLYGDQGLKNLLRVVPAGSDGRFCAALAPGTYYAQATVDFAANGAIDAGDMVGFFGVSDILGDRPQPLELAAGDLRTDVVISLTAQLDQEGRLVALTGADQAADDAPEQGPDNDDGR